MFSAFVQLDIKKKREEEEQEEEEEKKIYMYGGVLYGKNSFYFFTEPWPRS